MQKGHFIVIEGTDGSGKSTQFEMLINRLRAENLKIKTANFPQYGKKSAGLVEEYLNGSYGSAEEVGPHRASIFYACDRYDASFKIKEWLDNGFSVISDRYVGSNVAYQGSKIKDDKKRQEYIDWVYDLEYNLFEIPKPDVNIILDVSLEASLELLQKRDEKAYLKGKKADIHESNIEHLKNTKNIYSYLAKTYPDFITITCMEGDQLCSREKIAGMIWDKVINIIQ